MPVNYLIIESLQKFHHYYGDDFKVECPTGSGRYHTIGEVAGELATRLTRIFLRDENGERPVFGDQRRLQDDPHFRDHVLFHEYFHGDTGRGVGASHQTGWTGLVAKLLQPARRPSESTGTELDARHRARHPRRDAVERVGSDLGRPVRSCLNGGPTKVIARHLVEPEDAVSIELAQVIVASFELYVLAGVVFAVLFPATRHRTPRSPSRGAPRTLRLLILPGVAALWPLFAWRWIAGASEPIERNPHRAKAAAR